jgi:hypothetical protein
MPQHVPTNIDDIFASDARIVEVRVYDAGFVPNSYKYRAPGEGTLYRKIAADRVEVYSFIYDRKRSHGRGPRLVAVSAKGGRLYSE